MVAGARRRRQDGVAARAALFMGVLLVIVMVQKVAFTPQKGNHQYIHCWKRYIVPSRSFVV